MATQQIKCNACGKTLNGAGPVYYCEDCAAYYCMTCAIPVPGSTTQGTCPNCTAELRIANM